MWFSNIRTVGARSAHHCFPSPDRFPWAKSSRLLLYSLSRLLFPVVFASVRYVLTTPLDAAHGSRQDPYTTPPSCPFISGGLGNVGTWCLYILWVLCSLETSLMKLLMIMLISEKTTNKAKIQQLRNQHGGVFHTRILCLILEASGTIVRVRCPRKTEKIFIVTTSCSYR